MREIVNKKLKNHLYLFTLKAFWVLAQWPRALIHFPEKPPVKVWPQNIPPPPTSATSPQNIHILSQALSRELKILRIKYLKYSNISCVTPPVLHCAVSQSNTINNIELLFMEFTYICIRTIFH